jgi:Tfp pilus assembly protein PilF
LNLNKLKIPTTLCACVVLVLVFMVLGCAPGKSVPEDILNTPEHHVASGYKLLKKGYLFHAEREFTLALKLDPHSWNAQRGLGLTYARQNDFDRAFRQMRKAAEQAKTREAKALVDVGFMRVYILEGKDGWLDKVTQCYADAMLHDRSVPEAYFFMGMAYKKVNRFSEARKAFNKVLEINKERVAESEDQLRDLDRLEKAD